MGIRFRSWFFTTLAAVLSVPSSLDIYLVLSDEKRSPSVIRQGKRWSSKYLPNPQQRHTRAESKIRATHVKSMPTSTIHTPLPKPIVTLTVCWFLSLCRATMTRARSAANTRVDMMAVATESTREMTQGAVWNTQHDATTGRSVRNARPAATGCSTSRTVRALRMKFTRFGSFVTAARSVGSIVYPSFGPTHLPSLVKNVGLFSAL
jgi:hypothetical protein